MNNASSAIYTQLTTVAVLKNASSNQMDIVASVTGQVFVAKTPEQFSYDADGNTLSDGRWTNMTRDAENRLVSIETEAAAIAAGAPKQKLEFSYDANFRRTGKKVYSWSGSAWQLASEVRYVYDGWNLVAEVATTGSVVRSYVWGLDLSGTMQAAGGVGGLLAANLGSNGTHFVAYDGNGNVSALVDAATGAVSGNLEYGLFGEPVRVTGAAAIACPIRFSTKYEDAETGWLNYTFRLYDPNTGRWLRRDPFEEFGGLNVYSFALNAPTIYIDTDGRVVVESVGVATTLGTSSTAMGTTITVTGGTGVGAGGPLIIGGVGGSIIGGAAIGAAGYGGWQAGRWLDQQTGGAMSDSFADAFTYWWYGADEGEPQPTGSGSGGASGGGGTGKGGDDCKRKRCRPCIPPVGTTAGKVDTGRPHGGIQGPYVHFFEMHQVPLGTPPPGEECRCFWKRNARPAVPGTALPPGIPEVTPAAGGGVEYY